MRPRKAGRPLAVQAVRRRADPCPGASHWLRGSVTQGAPAGARPRGAVYSMAIITAALK